MKGSQGTLEATAEAFVGDWFHTDDAGTRDADRLPSMAERTQDVIAPPGATVVARQALEARLGNELLIERVALRSDQKRYAWAPVVPLFRALEEWAAVRAC